MDDILFSEMYTVLGGRSPSASPPPPVLDPEPKEEEEEVAAIAGFSCILCSTEETFFDTYELLEQHDADVHWQRPPLVQATLTKEDAEAEKQPESLFGLVPSAIVEEEAAPKKTFQKPFQCPLCQTRYGFKSHLQLHTRLEHQPFVLRQRLRGHSLPSNEHQPTTTDVTSKKKRESRHSNLEKIQAKEKPRVFRQEKVRREKQQEVHCLQCDKILSSSWHLKDHISRMHPNKKKQKKKYAQRNALEERRHYPCPKCSAKLTQACHLRRHLLEVHGRTRKRVSCPHCGRDLKNDRSLQRHIHSPFCRPSSSSSSLTVVPRARK